MSNQYYRTRYNCSSDCRQEGCPSHDLVLHVANTSDTRAVLVDGEIKTVFDDNQFTALLKLAEQKPEDSISHAEAYLSLKDVELVNG